MSFPAALIILAVSACGGEEPRSPAADELAGRLAAALRLKEERRLEDAVRGLEDIARPVRLLLPAAVPASPGRAPDPAARANLLPAASLVAELEAVDARLRLGKLDGLEERLLRLRTALPDAEVRRRARALLGVLYLHGGALLEPNAIARADIGDRVRERFYAGRDPARPAEVPLDLPIRHLSLLTIGPRDARLARTRSFCLVGFLGIEDLTEERRTAFRPALEHFDCDPRALLALFVFTGGAELPPSLAAEPPWNGAVVFWIRGTPEALANAPVRSRYEWIPGPSFFLVEPGGKIASWHWPHEGWAGFTADIRRALGARPPAAGTAAPPSPPVAR